MPDVKDIVLHFASWVAFAAIVGILMAARATPPIKFIKWAFAATSIALIVLLVAVLGLNLPIPLGWVLMVPGIWGGLGLVMGVLAASAHKPPPRR